jgi:hypothetical protein
LKQEEISFVELRTAERAEGKECRIDGTVPNDRLLYANLNSGVLMTAPLIRIGLRIVILILSWLIGLHAALASDELTPSSRVSSVRISVASYERIPIATILAHPDRYQMRDIRIGGTVMATQTETITNRLICGNAHERTTLMVEDDSGQIEVIDQGACGKNVGALKAPMLKTGQPIDLLVQIMIPTSSGTLDSSVEATIRYIDLARD